MELAMNLTGPELAKTRSEVESINSALSGGKAKEASPGKLGKEDFLKLLIMQLTHQDPTAPMKDTAFIAQMAQFSSLEQMTNVNKGLDKLMNLLQLNQAVGLLGRKVEVGDGSHIVEGTVEAVSGQDFPQLLVNGSYYDYGKLLKVLE